MVFVGFKEIKMAMRDYLNQAKHALLKKCSNLPKKSGCVTCDI